MEPVEPDRGSRRRPGPRRKRGLPSGPDGVRRAVLDAAASLFAERGVAQVSLRDIAGEARVNLGLISRYIGTRDDLVRAVFEDLTDQLVTEIEADPLGQRGFDQQSVMSRWAKVLGFLSITDPAVAADIGRAPLQHLSAAACRVYGLDERGAALRVAQIMGSALGWRIFEPYLVEASGLSDVPLDDLRDDLTRTHRRLGATPYPSPPDPPLVG